MALKIKQLKAERIRSKSEELRAKGRMQKSWSQKQAATLNWSAAQIVANFQSGSIYIAPFCSFEINTIYCKPKIVARLDKVV